MKKCTSCEDVLPKVNFYKAPKGNRSKDGLRGYCKKCWYERNHGNASLFAKKKRIASKERYGISVATIQRFGLKLALDIYEKYQRKCNECSSENDLTIHHIDGQGRHNEEKGFPINNNPDNLVVLCRKCHGSIHGKRGGRPNKNGG